MEKFNAYLYAAQQREVEKRGANALDTCAAISGALGGKGLTEYLKELQESLNG